MFDWCHSLQSICSEGGSDDCGDSACAGVRHLAPALPGQTARGEAAAAASSLSGVCVCLVARSVTLASLLLSSVRHGSTIRVVSTPTLESRLIYQQGIENSTISIY